MKTVLILSNYQLKRILLQRKHGIFFQDNLFSLTVVSGTEPEILSSQN